VSAFAARRGLADRLGFPCRRARAVARFSRQRFDQTGGFLVQPIGRCAQATNEHQTTRVARLRHPRQDNERAEPTLSQKAHSPRAVAAAACSVFRSGRRETTGTNYRFAPLARLGRCGGTSGRAERALDSCAVLARGDVIQLGLHRCDALELHVQGVLDVNQDGFDVIQPLFDRRTGQTGARPPSPRRGFAVGRGMVRSTVAYGRATVNAANSRLFGSRSVIWAGADMGKALRLGTVSRDLLHSSKLISPEGLLSRSRHLAHDMPHSQRWNEFAPNASAATWAEEEK
jgi:hypothetical protein